MINDITIKCFLELSETLSFTQTAKNLFLTQQTVSRLISNMEKSLGFQLFVRSKHFVLLTDVGEMYRDFFETQQKTLKLLHERGVAMCLEKNSSIKIGYQDSSDYDNIANLGISQLLNRFPTIDIQVIKESPMALVDKLTSGLLDVIVTYNRYAPHLKMFKGSLVLDLTLYLLTAANNKSTADAETWTDCLSCPLVFDSSEYETLSECKVRQRRLTAYMGLSPSEVIVAKNYEDAMRKVLNGDGIFICTRLTHLPQSSGLRLFKTDKKDALTCVWKVERENEAILHFVNSLSSAYNNYGADVPIDIV